MCDYSLEMYDNRPAKAGEKYVTDRFPSGSMGVIEDGKRGTAICIDCNTKLRLSGILPEDRARLGIGDGDEAVFTHLESGQYRDGLQFENGKEISLQDLPWRIGVEVIPATADNSTFEDISPAVLETAK